MHTTLNRGLIAFGGIVLGGVFLLLALRQYDPAQFKVTLAAFDRRTMALACGWYWLAIGARIVRWHTLLKSIRRIPALLVAEALIVGCAANNVFPARLGEFVRADYAKQRMGISRSTLLGSVVIERLLDLTIVLGCFAVGLLTVAAKSQAHEIATFRVIFFNAAVALVLAWLAVKWLSSRAGGGERGRWRRVLEDLGTGIGALTVQNALVVIAVSLLIWSAEISALYYVFSALHLSLSLAQTMLLLGAASLSTLIPTAPGYLGTYQLVFAFTMPLFAASETVGLVASVLIQVLFFGSVTLIGLLLYFIRVIRDIVAAKRASAAGVDREYA